MPPAPRVSDAHDFRKDRPVAALLIDEQQVVRRVAQQAFVGARP